MIVEKLEDVKTTTVAIVSAGTTGSGLGTILNWIPDDIGKLASLVGIFLSLTLIWKLTLEIRALRRKEKKDIG